MFVPDEGKKVNKAIFLLIVLLLFYIRKLKNRNYNQNFMINTLQERIKRPFDLMLNKLYNLRDQMMQQSRTNTQRSDFEKLHEDFSALLLKNPIVREKNFCNNYFKNEIKCLENSFLNQINREAMLNSKLNSSFFDTYFRCFYIDKRVLKGADEMNERKYVFNKCKMYFKSLEKENNINTAINDTDKEKFIKDFFYLKRESNPVIIKKISKLIEIDSELKFMNYGVKIFDQVYIFFYEL